MKPAAEAEIARLTSEHTLQRGDRLRIRNEETAKAWSLAPVEIKEEIQALYLQQENSDNNDDHDDDKSPQPEDEAPPYLTGKELEK